MNNCSKIILTLGLALSLNVGLFPTTDIAMSATAPVVSTLPAITAETSAPVRLATDSTGNIYATDPHAGGVLQYNSAGTLIKKIVTPKSGGGIAITQSGNLLVTQGTYVAVINPANGNEISRFGTFLYANGIAIDALNNIYVTDSRSNNVKKFDSNYNLVATSTTALSLVRPAGIAYDKANNRLAIANSMSAAYSIQFINTDLTLLSSLGTRGYDPTHADPTMPVFMYPQGISFEYTAAGALDRIYVAETFQSNIQVLDASGTWLADIGGYGFVNGKLYVPSDVLLDQFNQSGKRLLVANGGGTLAVYGIDGPPTNSFALTLATNGGNGTGTINGNTLPSGISVSCGENATCPQSTPIPSGETVNLTATANALTSVFGNWAGCDTINGNTCQFTMNSNKTITASFTLRKQFYVNGSYFDDLQAAYNAAADGSTIQIMTGTWPGNIAVGTFTANIAKTVTLKGGYDSQYSEPAVAGNTVITGRINVKAGKVIMNNIRNK